MEILVFGGSFDPPHAAHLALLAAGLRRRPGARAVVVPAWRSPLKGLPSASPQERLALTGAALGALPPALRRRVRLDDWELRRARVTYAYENLRRLRERHPGASLTFLAGGDSWQTLAAWRRPLELAASCAFLVGARPGAPAPRPGPGLPPLEALPGVFPDISSTALRARLLSGEAPAELPPAVLRRVRARRLYGGAMRARLEAELPPRRFEHTLAVSRMAVELALRHGADAERAALAGLLHDCGRAVPAPAQAGYLRARRLAVPALADAAREAPGLLHAHVSADRARRVYGVGDPAVLSAVRKHTLGDGEMSPLDRLLYAADACSMDRRYPEAAAIRRAARADLAAGYREAVRVKLLYVLREGAWMHPHAVTAWNAARERA